MRTRVLAIVAAVFAVVITTTTAAEAGWRRHYYDGYTADPYRYSYEPRRWYPYYNSGYWVPTAQLRYRRACCRPAYYALPPYYQSWGYPRGVYVQKGWTHRRYARRYHRRW